MIPDEAESAVLYGCMGELLSPKAKASTPSARTTARSAYSLAVELVNALIMGADEAQANG